MNLVVGMKIRYYYQPNQFVEGVVVSFTPQKVHISLFDGKLKKCVWPQSLRGIDE